MTGIFTEQTALATAVLLPLMTGIIIWVVGNRAVSRSWIPLVPVLVLGLLVAVAMGLPTTPGRPIPWAPGLGLELAFSKDGLALFFAFVVSGVGLLVFFYAVHYFGRPFPDAARFYGSMLIFMSAMLGTVLSSNMLALFVFWEITGLASFLLIGFLHEKEGSRLGARMALLVTGATGLCLLAGFVLIAGEAGSWDLQDWVAGEWRKEADPAKLNAACVLVFLGAMGKSAQVPFFFWLPNAMAAPTPVSAYLHSATMVKLGVFLSARMFPVLSETDVWLPMVAGVGGATFVLATALALFSHDLKAILAFSTVAQLGILISWYGIGALTGVPLDKFQILNHVLYKASLFMFVGIVDHCCHIRDIRRLGGLWKLSPWLAGGIALAALGMAGMPGTTGFVSKELMLKSLVPLAGSGETMGVYLLSCLLIGSVLKAAFSFRLIAGLLMGPVPGEMRKHWHAPSPAILVAPLLAASGVLVFGVYPQALSGLFKAWMVPGINDPDIKAYLAPFYGVNLELAISLAVLVLGFGLFAALGMRQWKLGEIPGFLRWDLAFDRGVEGWFGVCDAVNRFLRAEREIAWPRLVLAFFALLLLVSGWQNGLLQWVPSVGLWESEWSGVRVLTSALLCLGAVLVVVSKKWTTQLIALSTVGFLVTFYYVIYRAPDLAMTQILVETAALLLLVFLLARFPKNAEAADRLRGGRGGIGVLLLSASVGVVTTLLALTLSRPIQGPEEETVGDLVLEATKPLGFGQNAVNVVLVDFRGFDTLGEIFVLLIALLGCVGVLMCRRGEQQAPTSTPQLAAPSFIFRSLAIVLFFIMNVFAVYLLLRGHYEPGGGFIGGLVSAMSFILVILGMGPKSLMQVRGADPLRLAVLGGLLALTSSVLPMLWGSAFLQQYNAYVDLPLLGKTALSTTLIFDTGVFLLVVGISVKALLLLVRNAAGLQVFDADQQARYAAIWEEPVERGRTGPETDSAVFPEMFSRKPDKEKGAVP